MIKHFETILLEEAFEFIQKQNLKSRSKILQNADPKFFKKLNNDIWEFRTLYAGIQYRLLAFWDKENKNNTLVFATHGIIKKTSKVDKREIEKTKNIKTSYFKNKKNENL